MPFSDRVSARIAAFFFFHDLTLIRLKFVAHRFLEADALPAIMCMSGPP